VPDVDVFDAGNRAELRQHGWSRYWQDRSCILIREAWRQAAITASSEAEFRLVDVEVLQLVGVVDELP
jgi:hypothetical protein